MPSHRPSGITRISQVAASSVLFPVLLVLGLLSSPVICQCGSALPHDHSLFVLSNHSHAPGTDDHHGHRHGAADDDTSVARRNAAEASSDGPTLQAASDFASGKPRAVALANLALIQGEVDSRIPEYTYGLADANYDRPDPPPPRA